MSQYLMMKTLTWVFVFGPCIISLDAIPLQRTDLEEGNKQVRTLLICPTGFIPLGESCYAFGEEQGMDWYDSQTYCGSLAPGGKLIEIETAEEFYAVFTYIRENQRVWCGEYWIGAQERGYENNNFEWASTRWPVLFYNWWYDQPNDSRAGDAIVVSSHQDWQWGDTGTLYDYACQLCEAPPTGEAVDSST
ncbi:unnamed protein product [Cyprideis torosa]|uniref:Uncharacterized protein n=1 Tax=Cyprideis torosa TaxID=163714 RepID=A0A7R8WAU3_9CRUS|nr:unnamed protein product [Cyprideis torosa]CAG0891462.1 unnamed protein product [Cyprideis torosa]